MHEAIWTSRTGMNGMTSVAPIRGWPPRCCSMSISPAATRAALIAA